MFTPFRLLVTFAIIAGALLGLVLFSWGKDIQKVYQLEADNAVLVHLIDSLTPLSSPIGDVAKQKKKGKLVMPANVKRRK